MRARISLLLPLVFVACASQPSRPLNVQLVPDGIPEVRGYHFTDVYPLLQQALADEFSAATADGPVLTLQVERGTLDRPDVFAPAYNQLSNFPSRPEIVWFNLRYTLRAPSGAEKRGVVPVFGPDPGGFGGFQEQRLSVLRAAVIRLRQATASF